MKDLGEAAYILGIKIYRDRSRRLIGLSQSTYLDKVLKKFKMDQAKKRVLACITRCEVESDSISHLVLQARNLSLLDPF